MIDIKLIREDPELVRNNTKSRGYDENIVNRILEIDKNWRELKKSDDVLRQSRNRISEEINKAKKKKGNIDNLMKEAKTVSDKLGENREGEKKLEEERRNLLLCVPNILKESVPIGKDENDNKELRKCVTKPDISNPLSHAELGESLDILDLKRAAKITGSGFYILKGEGARLQRALIQFMLDFQYKSGRIE